MKSFSKSLEEIKKAGEDFEWYPTDTKMLNVICQDIIKNNSNNRVDLSILDVGAGNGSSLSYIKKNIDGKYGTYQNDYISSTLYAIEKSQILINSMDKDIFIIGTDFYHQTFIDKNMDITFCNPPYSDFTSWATKLIKESNSDVIYFVIPERWKDNEEMQSLIKDRKGKSEILGSFSFIDSEYRKARAKVDIVKVYLNGYDFRGVYRTSKGVTVDPFKLWFDENFHFNQPKDKEIVKEEQEKREESLVDKSKVIDNLVKYYNEALDNLIANYQGVEELDSNLLEELGVKIESLKEGLKVKIDGLKNSYWKELFDNLEAITDRLTSESRNSLLSTLLRNTTVDFTHENIYSIVLWSVKNANKYFEDQLLDLYLKLTEPKNIINYKSNKHMTTDTWRNTGKRACAYKTNEKIGKYILDYRCVLEGCYGISIEGNWQNEGHLLNNGHKVISDIFTIAKNLGFEVEGDSRIREWVSGKNQLFYTKDNELFAEIKAFKNGNIHYKLNQKFMQKFNIEAGRLNGWIKSPEEASEEMNIKLDVAASCFGSNVKLLSDSIKLLQA